MSGNSILLICGMLALAALLSAGVADVKVNIREYDVPTPNSGPHDPMAAADGSLWYTGQSANTLGR